MRLCLSFNPLSFMGALAMIWITALQPVLSASEIPRPLITVKRELGDPNTKLPPIGIVGLDDFSKLYIYSPEKRLLGQTQAVLTQTEYKTETLKRIQQERSHYLIIDAFYPRELKAHSKKEIQRTIEHTIAREVL